MRTLLVFILLYSNTLFASSFEVEAVHLKNGDVVSAQDESYSVEEVRAVEIVDENKSYYLVSLELFEKLINGGDAGGGSPMAFGGDMGGGSPMMKMSIRAATRVGGDGSGGG